MARALRSRANDTSTYTTRWPIISKQLPDPLDEIELGEMAKLLEEWLKNLEGVAAALGVNEEDLLTPMNWSSIFSIVSRIRPRPTMAEPVDRHHGMSPVGHSGFHPGGMRVGGVSQNRSATKVALDRRYRDYSRKALTQSQMGKR